MLIFDRLVLDVSDVDRSVRFYTQTLDFETINRTTYLGHRAALLHLGLLHLFLLEQPGSTNPLSLPKSGPVITLSETRIDERYLDLQRADVEILAPLAESPWGGRSFLIKDPDAYLIVIQEPSGRDGAE